MPPALVDDILALARRTTGPTLDAEALRERIERYGEMRTAYEGDALRAVILVDRIPTSRGELVYLGPAFSEGASYVALFASLVSEALASGAPFAFAIEAESRAVVRTLAALLPTTSYPRASSSETPSHIGVWAKEMLSAASHVDGFDERRMTSTIVRPLHRGDTRGDTHGDTHGRYRVLFVPCDGASSSRETIRAELADGLAVFQRRCDAIATRRRAKSTVHPRVAA